MAFDATGWLYYKTLTIDQTDTVNAVYQHRIDVHWGGLTANDVTGAFGTAIVHTPSAVAEQHDFNDLRFTTDAAPASATELNYWIESSVHATSCVVWVAVTLPNNANDVTIRMYYGNAGASAVSSGENTFIQYHGAASATFMDAAVTPTTGGLRYRGSLEIDSGGNIVFGLSSASARTGDSIEVQVYDGAGYYANTYNNSTGTSGTPSGMPTAGTYYILEGRLLFSTSYKIYDVSGTQLSTTSTTNLPDAAMGLRMWEASNQGNQEWSFVAKYTDKEPVWSSFGAETSTGWANIASINGVASSGIASVNGVAVAGIAYVNGVAV